MTEIPQRLQQVKQRMQEAAERTGRSADEVLLVCVTKTRSTEQIAEAVRAGAVALGENYAQEMVAKRTELSDLPQVQWHFIGHLQRNKVKYLAPFCDMIHSLDSLRLAEEINRRAGQHGRKQPVLIEVNCAAEDSKFGTTSDRVLELAEAALQLPNLDLQGLMTMAPYDENPEHSRPVYQQLARLKAQLAAEGLPADALRHLSMGMTQDYEVAIEEGATIVRIGTAIFGPRPS